MTQAARGPASRNLIPAKSKGLRQRRRKALLGCELLEDRALMATLAWSGGGMNGLWSNPANWDGTNTPSATYDQLTFPAVANKTMTDDLGTLTLDLSFQDSGYSLANSGSAILFDATHGITATYAGGSTPIDVPVTATADSTLAVTNAAATLTFGGAFGVSGGATLDKTGAGAAYITSANTGSLAGTLQVSGGTLRIADSAGFASGTVALNGGILATDPGILTPGIVSSVSTTAGGGTVSPGGTGTIGLLGFSTTGGPASVVLNHAVVQMDVHGTAFADHDQIGLFSGAAAINLTGATLAVDTTGYTPTTGDQIVLIDYSGGTLTGQFTNAPQGTPVNFGGNMYTLDYAGGTGTQVVLSPFIGMNAQDDVYSLPPNTTLVTGSNQPTLFVPPPGILTNDTTPYGLPLTPELLTPAQHGTVLLSTDGSFTYQPAVGFVGTDSFTYQNTDSQGHVSNTATVTLYINATDLPPVGYADNFTATQSLPITVNVTNNDYSPSGNPLTATLVAGPVHGTLTDNGGGSFTYTPDAGYTGVDGFIYAAVDTVTGLTSGATNVTFNVGVLNQAPTAVDDAYSTAQNSPLFVVGPGVLINDTDPNGDTLSSVIVGNPSHGTLSLSNNGSFSYTPDPNFHGTDTFTYQVSDGSLVSNVATVTITVSPVPVVPTANDDNYTLNEDTTLTVAAPGLLLNDLNPSGNPLSINIVNGPQNGTLSVNNDGSLTYTPNTNSNGLDSFTYYLHDTVSGLNSGSATVTLNVLPVPDAPVAVADAFVATENQVLQVGAPGVLANDLNPDGNPLSAVLVQTTVHGALSLNSDGSFTYTPDANYSGPDSFSYQASAGGLLSGVVTVSLSVTAVPTKPVATGDDYALLENGNLTIAAPGLLLNDQNPSGNPLSINVISGPLHGTLSVNNDGSFTYTPAADYNGADSFTYYLHDTVSGLNSGSATVALNVLAVPVAPIGQADAYSTNEGSTLNVSAPGVLLNDTNVNSTPASAVLVDNVQHGTLTLNADGSFTYTPAAYFHGTDTFTYQAVVGSLSSAITTVTITVNPVANAPTANDDAYSLLENNTLTVVAPGLLLNDQNPDGNPLSINVVNGPQHGTLSVNNDGSFTYTPAADYNGADSFVYYLHDTVSGLNSGSATVTLTVQAVATAPVAVDDAYSTNEDVPLSVSAPGVLQNDLNPDGPPLNAVLVNGPSHGSVQLNSDGSFTYTPVAYYNGTDTFTYRANNGSLFSNVATVTITVNAVATAPTAVDDSYTTQENTALTVAPPGLLLNDLNPDGNPLTINVVNGPQHGTLSVNDDGSFTYTPATYYNGADSFVYYLHDTVSGLNSNQATVTLTVQAVATAPTAVDDAYSTNESVPLSVSAPGVLQNDLNPDGTPLTAVLVNGPSHGSVQLNSDGSFTYTPVVNYNGTDTFTYRASTGGLVSNVATVTITVNPVNTAPVAMDDAYTTQEDQRLNVPPPGILGNDYDVDGPTITAVLVNPTQNGVLMLNPDGSFTYTPNPNFSGTDRFTYRATDGLLQSNLATVTITVTRQREVTIQLAPSSDTGYSDTDNITRDNTPTFIGTAEPGLIVALYARPAGSSAAPTYVGYGIADGSGHWTATSTVLADGLWNFYAEGRRPDGLSTGVVGYSGVLIDTVAPVILGSLLSPQANQVSVTFRDAGSGMAYPTISDPANYALTKKATHAPRAFVIDYAQPLPTAADGSQTVILNSSADRLNRVGRYLFTVISGGIADAAGNSLDGEFNGSYPTGDGQGGGNFNAQFLVVNHRPVSAQPTNVVAPILSVAPGGLRTPQGPRGVFRGRVLLTGNLNLNVQAGTNARQAPNQQARVRQVPAGQPSPTGVFSPLTTDGQGHPRKRRHR